MVSTLKSDVETTLKMGCFPDVEINYVVSTLKIGCSTSQPKINLKTTLKQRCVPAGLLPMAIQYLSEHNQLQVWVHLFKCLANRTLPLHNISYRLFLDVVTWFSSENACTKRNSDIVKRFWRTGSEIFKGKFLRFISGMKNKGQSLAHESLPGCSEPSQSSINFIVPSRNILQLDD